MITRNFTFTRPFLSRELMVRVYGVMTATTVRGTDAETGGRYCTSAQKLSSGKQITVTAS